MFVRMLLGNRTEPRYAEKLAIALTKPFQYLSPTLLTTPIETLAKAMLANTIYSSEGQKSTEIVDNCKIFELAKLLDQPPSQ